MATYTGLGRCGIFHDPSHLKQSLRALNDQRNLSQFCDVVLKVCGTQIYAHSNVLAAASPYFGSILGIGADCPRGFSQKQPQIIEIHIDSHDGDGGYGEAVSKVVEFMYTSHITLKATLITQIIEIGKIMRMDTLLQFCDMFQNGEDNNDPKNVSTCTTGLEEIAKLLGSRTKTLKKADASTETEESVFCKVRPEVNLDLGSTSAVSSFSTSARTDTVLESKSGHDLLMEQQTQELDNISDPLPVPVNGQKHDAQGSASHDLDDDMPISTNIGFESMDQDQNDASLLLAISNVRPPLSASDSVKSFEEKREVSEKESTGDRDERMSTPEPEKTELSVQEKSITDECFSDIRTVADMMVAVVKNEAEVENSADAPSCSASDKMNTDTMTKSDSTVSQGISQVSGEVKLQKNIDLDEISDLVKFYSVESAQQSSASSKIQVQTSTRSRGRGRGRGRGRRRGRGRGPGRPRKVLEEPESDPEFEEFIERLERGDDVLHNSDDESKKANRVKESESTTQLLDSPSLSITLPGDDGVSSGSGKELQIETKPVQGGLTQWKSKRVRSKPSQLKKDYVMHSLGKKSRKQHSESKQEETSEINQPVLPNQTSNIVVQNTSKSGLKFVCEKCDFASPLFKEYRQHLKVHPETDPKYFLCNKCDFKTTKAREHKVHKHKHMSEEFICSYCEHQSENHQAFEEHVTKHEGALPYFCTECDSRFRTKNQLVAHKPKHQLVKPFVCAICSAGFKWKHALKNHMITHNPSKDHLCDVCGYATAHKSQLKAHKLIHSGQLFKCPVSGCQFEAIKRQNLKYHMITHTHEKPHQCEICGQSFSLIKNMKRHMLLHSDSRRYSCKICSFNTTRYDKLKEHHYKLHNISEQPALRKTGREHLPGPAKTLQPKQEEEQIALISPDITYVASEGIQINADGTISEEALQQIAQLASAQNSNVVDIQSTSIDISEQATPEASGFPIIATVQYTDGQEVQYIAEVAE